MVPESESIVLSEQVICAQCKPEAVAKLVAGEWLGNAGMWRDGPVLVMGRKAAFPGRCIKCNAETPRRLTRRLSWHHPAWYVLLVLNFILYAVAVIFVHHQVKIEFGLCQTHRRRWIFSVAAGLLLCVGGFATLVFSVVTATDIASEIGVAMLIGGLVGAVFGCRLVSARRIDRRWMRIAGAGQPFLNSLPDLPASFRGN